VHRRRLLEGRLERQPVALVETDQAHGGGEVEVVGLAAELEHVAERPRPALVHRLLRGRREAGDQQRLDAAVGFDNGEQPVLAVEDLAVDVDLDRLAVEGPVAGAHVGGVLADARLLTLRLCRVACEQLLGDRGVSVSIFAFTGEGSGGIAHHQRAAARGADRGVGEVADGLEVGDGLLAEAVEVLQRAAARLGARELEHAVVAQHPDVVG
jgi:hypothetical protein